MSPALLTVALLVLALCLGTITESLVSRLGWVRAVLVVYLTFSALLSFSAWWWWVR